MPRREVPLRSLTHTTASHSLLFSADVVGATEFEYKFTVRPPPPAASKLPQTQQAQQPSWLWAPGPNRKAALPAVAAGASPATFGLSSAWMASRDGTLVIAQDGYMEPNRGHLAARYRVFSDALVAIEAESGGLDAFSRGYEYLGFNRGSGGEGGATPGIFYREWAPNAQAACLVGEFNGWAVGKHPCTRDAWGVWTLFMPDGPDGAPAIRHNTAVKLCLTLPGGGPLAYRLPAWIRYAVYDAPANEYVGRYWNPPAAEKHVWKHARRSTHTADDYRATPGMPRMQDVAGWTGAEPPPALKAPSGASRVLHPIAQPQQQGKQSAATSTAESKAAATAAAAARGPVDPAAAGLRIYEAHVGMAGEAERVSTYREFADAILPRIVATGYNCVQLMAVMEHAYYGSFGYHVTSFLAPSSRFGTPEDLKYLVDAAHAAGLLIIMDCVHSHASKNVNDGINNFDGTEFQYFHSGPRGNHDLWDSRLFDYSKREVQRFLLSSARLFVEEFRFDGYRFDGVTSMMYHHHGLSYGFSGDYNEYFGEHTDLPAMAYLMLVNTLLHGLDPPALSIAEDVSGMPTLCRPVWEGGVGFDYRLGMAIPDMWIKLLKEVPDDDWNMGAIVGTLTNRRWQERTIAYAESHDQALVGDKTLAFWLMDKEMYWHMKATESPPHPVIARGLALHKVIRLLTCALGGEAFLTFMGNEFGHPEWIDFPRVGNGWSYKHCRR